MVSFHHPKTSSLRYLYVFQKCTGAVFSPSWGKLKPFQTIWAEREQEGGTAVFHQNRWCNPGQVIVKEHLCWIDGYMFLSKMSTESVCSSYLPMLHVKSSAQLFATVKLQNTTSKWIHDDIIPSLSNCIPIDFFSLLSSIIYITIAFFLGGINRASFNN